MKSASILLLPILGLSLHLAAQQSLGDVARQTRSNKAASTHAKVVVDDDSTPLSSKSPFPGLEIDGLDNTEEIIKAMESYRLSHTSEDFVATIRSWYEEYNSSLDHAITDQKIIQDRQYSRARGAEFSSIDRNNDPSQYRKRQMAEIRAADNDRRRFEADGQLCSRIQRTFTRVRYYLSTKGMKFDWFKIRYSNGTGTW